MYYDSGIVPMKQIAIGVCVAIVLLLAGCSRQVAEETGPPAKGGKRGGGTGRGGAVAVATAQVTERAVPIEIRVVGSVEAYSTIRVRNQVTGQLTKVYFQEGQEVKAGDLMFLVDPRPYDEAIRQAEANQAKNTALLRQAEANLKRDEAGERFAREQAARYQRLMSEGVMSKQQADQYASDADSRQEALRADQAAIESAQAALKADEATIANAKLQRAYCEIRSPIDGRTGNLTAKEGNLVRVNDPELVTINQIHPIYVTFSVPENRLAEVKKYMAAGKLAVSASPAGDTGPAEMGTVSFVDNTVDTTTGTIRLKATFPNDRSRLWPGQFVNVVLRLTVRPDARVVPARAVQMSQDGEFAYVVNDQAVQMRPVVTGPRVGEDVVIEKGLEVGETVVTEGQLRLAPGMRVRTRGGRGS
jgi:multidrug efflux system membrane fusion protein